MNQRAKHVILERIILLIIACSLLSCGPDKSSEAKIYGTWFYVNGNDETSKVYIIFEKEGEMKLGVEDSNVSVSYEEWNEILLRLFGDLSDLIKQAGINVELSPIDLSDTLNTMLLFEYEVIDAEEIEFEIMALKLVSFKRISQYHFKENGDLVLNGLVFRRK